MTFTAAARQLLKRLERFSSAAYQDEAGVWTIGYGHTGDVRSGQSITQHQAEVVLDHDLQRFTTGVTHFVQHAAQPLSDAQFSALVIFCFNVGVTAFAGSTALRDVLSGHLDRVPAELARWHFVHDRSGVPVVSRILVARRAAEIALWNSPTPAPREVA